MKQRKILQKGPNGKMSQRSVGCSNKSWNFLTYAVHCGNIIFRIHSHPILYNINKITAFFHLKFSAMMLLPWQHLHDSMPPSVVAILLFFKRFFQHHHLNAANIFETYLNCSGQSDRTRQILPRPCRPQLWRCLSNWLSRRQLLSTSRCLRYEALTIKWVWRVPSKRGAECWWAEKERKKGIERESERVRGKELEGGWK